MGATCPFMGRVTGSRSAPGSRCQTLGLASGTHVPTAAKGRVLTPGSISTVGYAETVDSGKGAGVLDSAVHRPPPRFTEMAFDAGLREGWVFVADC